jgi:hypothetical protein
VSVTAQSVPIQSGRASMLRSTDVLELTNFRDKEVQFGLLISPTIPLLALATICNARARQLRNLVLLAEQSEDHGEVALELIWAATDDIVHLSAELNRRIEAENRSPSD